MLTPKNARYSGLTQSAFQPPAPFPGPFATFLDYIPDFIALRRGNIWLFAHYRTDKPNGLAFFNMSTRSLLKGPVYTFICASFRGSFHLHKCFIEALEPPYCQTNVSCSLLLIPSCHISDYFSVIFPKSICSTKPNIVFFVSNYKNNSFESFAFTINKSSKFFSVIGTKTLLSTNP